MLSNRPSLWSIHQPRSVKKKLKGHTRIQQGSRLGIGHLGDLLLCSRDDDPQTTEQLAQGKTDRKRKDPSPPSILGKRE
jgi:hypothetical protein